VTAVERIEAAYGAIAASGRPEVWISLRDPEDALADARVLDERVAGGEQLPLAGRTLAVKDNIDVTGLPTTAACPAFAYEPSVDAPAVTRLCEAGAVVLGKTNMDQFATGLVGTRSPYGAVRDARRPQYVSGGSSSGSAVAVALGLADLALGTDTAGSGRVPAAFQGIVGIKPTHGLVPVRGVVPACRSFDCVSVFARTVAEGEIAAALLSGPDPEDPLSRSWRPDAPLAAPPAPRVGVPRPVQLDGLSRDGRRAFEDVAAALEATGAALVEVDIGPCLEAGGLLYDGAFLAERYAAVGEFIAAHRAEVDPTVAGIITAGASITAHQYVADRERLDHLRLEAMEELREVDALLVPTAPSQPTIAEVEDDPIGIGRRLGTYTNFCNLLDFCAVAVPGGEADWGQFGVTLMAPAFHDRVVADLARRLAGETELHGPSLTVPATGGRSEPPAFELLVVGAHLRGQPLNGELTIRGARFVRAVRTASCYRLYRLDTAPAKPGLVRTEDPNGFMPGIEGELWSLPPAGLASFLASVPMPMTLGRVRLADGTETIGFLCEPAALTGAEDITEYGGWLAAG
jgi:allophanate hydrolase